MFDTSQMNTLIADLAGAPAKARPLVSAAIRKTAFDIQHDAQQLAPVDTGFLVGSIGVTVDDDGMGALIGPTAEYAGFVEFGTEAHPPQPFMSPAFDRRVPDLMKAISQATGI
ncbi:HK97-gp10 family putative phage morphogenesis protein [Aeromicrobium sp.]|uniref:HK97-gp10 family putative phage morphogenesis protein n=1 Tax=Aeromicrobium sp. TaxID=1871063 RepID=UPI0030BDEFBA